MRYRNTSESARVWPWLTNAETGSTLQLGPGETAQVDGDVGDPRLAQVKTPKPKPEPKD